MGWWKSEDGAGAIGDGPADALSLALSDLRGSQGQVLDLPRLLARFHMALEANSTALLGDPETLEGKILLARFEDGSEHPEGGRGFARNDEGVRRFYAALEETSTLYRNAYRRKPTMAEVLETFAFVLRGREEVQFPTSAELENLHLDQSHSGNTVDQSDILVTLRSGAAASDVAAAPSIAALNRDPDRGITVTTSDGWTAFASWSGVEGDDREVDFHADVSGGSAWLAVRGRNAKALAQALARELDGRISPSAEDGLADLMSPPASGATTTSGLVRWRSLQAALSASDPQAFGLRSMIAAGLRDPDWRARMLSVIGVGRLRLADRAHEAMAAKVPPAVELQQEDRHILLALRHAAHNLALGLDGSAGLVGAADVLPRRIAFQERLRQTIDDPQADVSDRAGLLVAVLRGLPIPADTSLPHSWSRWKQ